MSNISSYSFDNEVTASDFLIGTDAENSKKTKNYLIADIVGLVPLVVGTQRVEIDFGSLPVPEKEFTIADIMAKTTSNITASLAYEAPTDKDLDEVEMDALFIICGQAEAGSFKIFIKAIDGSYLADKFKINYLIT
tara:strand:+ start:667 stop:1074 length:408 start_codon:yes stop_codon:yes gene_type:complete